MCKSFYFCACGSEFLLKNAEQNFYQKTVIILTFKLKTQVIWNKYDFGGNNFVMFFRS